MGKSRLLYYISDRTAFATDEPTRRRQLLEKIAEAARSGVDYIQLREKDLSTRDLESLARDAVSVIRDAGRLTTQKSKTALLINSRIDAALAVGADGVHLRSSDISPQEVREIWKCGAAHCREDTPFDELGAGYVRQASPQLPLIGVSCHSSEDVARAAANGASFAVFAPVFEKKDAPAAQAKGLSLLREACQASIPVFALGGVTLANAHSCIEAGAAGIAAIRLFQENDIERIVRELRQGSAGVDG